ncbi:MAG: glycosyltransferase, partial [Ignavibacteriae bacterium]
MFRNTLRPTNTVNCVMTTVLLAVFAATYVARIAFFFRGFYRERGRWQSNTAVPTVTVLVPARNEAENIERCVHSLMMVDYPADKLEVIIVDDRSSDATPEILDNLAARHTILKVLHRNPQEVDPNLRG